MPSSRAAAARDHERSRQTLANRNRADDQLRPVDVVDTIGAGDAFGAALLAWLHDHDAVRPDLSLEHDELKAALTYACLAASLTCARAGADPPWKREMVAAT